MKITCHILMSVRITGILVINYIHAGRCVCDVKESARHRNSDILTCFRRSVSVQKQRLSDS